MCDMQLTTYRVSLNHVWVFLLFSAIFLIGCSKKETENLPPSIALLDQAGAIIRDTTVGVNSQMTFAIAAQAGSTNLTNLIIKVSTSESSERYLDTSMNISGFSISKKFVKGLADAETWTFIIRDKNRLSDSLSLIIYRDTAIGFNPIIHIEALTLSAQNNPFPGSFYSFVANKAYPPDQAFENQEFIDLVYYFGEDELTMGSPGANIETGIFEGDLLNWTTRNTTRFIELDLPPEVFDQAQNDSLLIASYHEAEGKRKAKMLATGKMFSFKTTGLKYGIFRVLSTEGTDAGSATFEIKIQE